MDDEAETRAAIAPLIGGGPDRSPPTLPGRGPHGSHGPRAALDPARLRLVAAPRLAIADLGRARLLQAALLVAAIVVGAAFVLRANAPAREPLPASAVADASPTSQESSSTTSSTTSSATSSTMSSTTSTGAAAHVEIRRFASVGALRARYRAVVPEAGAGTRGAVRCARGRAEERTWSRPSAPARVAGRYACRHDGDVAELWWTDEAERVLGLVRRSDGDLAAAHRWWVRDEPPERALDRASPR